MVTFWLALFFVLLVVEAATVALTSLWFAVGALAAMVFAMFSLPLWSQIAVFFAVSGACVAFLRPFATRVLKLGRVKTNADRLIGGDALVLEEIDNLNAKGLVKTEGQVWSARSASEEKIPVETVVRVKEISGVKLIVERKEED